MAQQAKDLAALMTQLGVRYYTTGRFADNLLLRQTCLNTQKEPEFPCVLLRDFDKFQYSFKVVCRPVFPGLRKLIQKCAVSHPSTGVLGTSYVGSPFATISSC